MRKPPHVAIIFELNTHKHAMLDPGILEVYPGDMIEYQNQTAAAAQLVIAQAGIFKGVPSMEPQSIPGKGAGQFTVEDTARPGIYEYAVAVTLSTGVTVLAIGGSTPRIIIRSTSQIG
jgi:hypothetical protein